MQSINDAAMMTTELEKQKFIESHYSKFAETNH